MAMESGRRPGSALSEINVTPFVDVMLVLLVIFMVTAPLVTQGVEVRLPTARARQLEAQREPVVVTVARDGRIYINRTEVRLADLRTRIERIFDNRAEADREVYLRADAEVPYGVVVRAVAELKRAGVGKLGMVTEPPGDRP
ncbi:MAG TPA: protein TolR [Thermodesulfobacteriota bacterium]|nr:protein TolR [Thermodesulfobacteriota bacterium]